MYKTIEAYVQEKPYLIAIDSDGCVFDNMTIKHQAYFFPALLEVFAMTDADGKKALLWDQINLSYPTRGLNRFKGLAEFFKVYKPSHCLDAYSRWVETSQVLKNDALEGAIDEGADPLMVQVLSWSKTVNEQIKKNLTHVQPFQGAIESIKQCASQADLVILSSANQDAILREWESAGLLPYVRLVASQDMGTKEACLKGLIAKGYALDKVLVIGDAKGDYYAARENFAHYYQIKYQEEEQCWKAFNAEYRDLFFQGSYAYDGDEVLSYALEDALKVIKRNVDVYTDRFQHVSVDGVYPLEVNKLWTMSFYPGQLYLAYELTKDQDFLRNKDRVLASFKERCDKGHMDTHDIGFLFELTAYYDYKLTGNQSSRALVIAAADKLMVRYQEKGGYLQAWGKMNPEADQTRIIIDTMMNLPLLHIATELTGDPKYKEAAISHARVSSHTLLRPDASTYHSYWMNVQTGQAIAGATHQGHLDESTWARGQAWSLYGFYKSYEWTKDPDFLDAAIRSADVFIEHLPKNDICYWDFDFDDEHPDIRDSSAASIAAAGLLKLAKVVDAPLGESYEEMAITLLKRLANRYQNTKVYEGCGILKEGMYHRDEGARAFTSWGDYYYVEALSTFFQQE